jgi:hypothetical protein
MTKSTQERKSPQGLPRLLDLRTAAWYCGISPNQFVVHIGPRVKSTSVGRRKLWDIKVLDKHIDSLSGIASDEQSKLGMDHWLAKLDNGR